MLLVYTTIQQYSNAISKSDYDTLQISEIIHQLAPDYITDHEHQLYQQIELKDENISIQYQNNLTQYLNNYIFTQHKQNNYTQQYLYAALQYLNGIQLMFGIKQPRQQMKAMMSLEVAHRYGCNEATIFIANAHKHGIFGYSKSSLIALNYYKALYGGWATQASDASPYQYNYNLYNLELELGKDVDSFVLSTSQRQQYIIELIEHSTNRELYGNIVASGLLTGSFGFKENELMSSKFAYLAAKSDIPILLDKDKNNIQQFLKEQMNETDGKDKYRGIYERVGKQYLHQKEQQKDQQNGIIQQIKIKLNPLFQFIKKIMFGKNQKLEIDSYDLDAQYKKLDVDKATLKKLQKFKDNFTIDEINLFNYQDIIPMTKEGFYDAITKLSKEITYQIYQKYKYFKIFNNLPNRNKASKEDVLNVFLWSNQTLIQQAVRMFIDNTDRDIFLQTLRNNNAYVDLGYDQYYDNLMTVFQGNRAFKETCSRRGQAFGLLGYFLKGGDYLPQEVVDTKMNQNYARIMSLGSAFYGCHMGLTGLAFDAMEGYRPYKNPKINQATLKPIKATKQNLTNSMIVYPEPKQAIMGLDIASQAGSFESSYYEALLLSHNIYEYSPKLSSETQWLYSKQFQNIGYQSVAETPLLARLLAEHSCHAGHIGGQFLYGLMLYNGYGVDVKDKIGSLEIMQRASDRIVVDQFFDKYIKNQTEPYKRFASSFIFALSGDDTSLINILKQNDQKFIDKVYMNDRKGKQEQVQQTELLIELAYYLQNNKLGIQTQFGNLCDKYKQQCIFAVTGLNVSQVNTNEKQQNLIKYLKNILTQYDSLDYYVLFAGQKWLEDHYNKNLSQLMIDQSQKQQIIKNNITSKQFIINQLSQEQNSFGQLLYSCFLENNTFQKKINSFGLCYQISELLNYIKGNQTFYINKLQTYDSRPGEESEHFTIRHLQQLNELLTNLIKRVPDEWLVKLLKHEQFAEEFKVEFDTQYGQLEPSDVRKLMENNFDEDLEPSTMQILQQTDYINNQYNVSDIKVQTKQGRKSDGFYAPNIDQPNQLFNYGKLNIDYDNSNQLFIIKLYIQYRKYINLILICLIVAILIITLDIIRNRKLQKANNGMMSLSQLLEEENEESEDLNDQQKT